MSDAFVKKDTVYTLTVHMNQDEVVGVMEHIEKIRHVNATNELLRLIHVALRNELYGNSLQGAGLSTAHGRHDA